MSDSVGFGFKTLKSGRLIEVQYNRVEMAVNVVLFSPYSKALVKKWAYVKIDAKIIETKH